MGEVRGDLDGVVEEGLVGLWLGGALRPTRLVAEVL